MTADVLVELDLTPDQTHRLSGHERRRLFNFLLRWRHSRALHACLDALIADTLPQVALLDVRARAFLIDGRPDDALAIMNERLERSTSLASRALLARIHLNRGDLEAARQVAYALTTEREDRITYWALLGEIELTRGDRNSALAAYRRVDELRPHSRTYLLGMVAFYQAQDDWVTASGYAVRLLRTATEERPLSVAYLHQLHDYFQASGEETRLADLEEQLERRYAAELAELRDALSPAPRTRSTARPRTESLQARESIPAEPLSTLEQIPVSAEERAHIAQAVKQLFGFEDLLPGQVETLACVLRGEDVLTILPTGGGKSLCYQLPAMLDERGTTLVISPLIALMKDQIDSLPAGLRSKATEINSSLEGDELRRRLSRLTEGAYRLAYVAPERLRQPTFLHAMRQADLRRLVIDEAHCVSVWGHDFRPDYLTIDQVREALGSPPLLALTATAPPRVRRDIVGHLGDLRIVAGDVTRPNLTFEVFYARNPDEKLRRLLAFCRATPGSGIVYVDTRARSEELAALLRRHGVVADRYHGGVPDRARVQDDFMSDRTRVVVATIAFGMGIDKPNIRFIVHFFPPRSLEAYYQEAGRAGRDGLPAHCLLMYAPTDRATLTRRSRRDLLPIDFVRATYAAVRRRLNGRQSGRVVRADLERDLKADDTRVRVTLSLLEEAGLLRCGPDVPRTATVRLMDQDKAAGENTSGHNAAFESFCQAARLRPGQALNLDLLEVARQAELPLMDIERRVLEWAGAGWLTYYSSGQDLLVELPTPPLDASERVAALLERYETIQMQRVDEIAAYVQARRCRHGHINAYLGGRVIERCTACDNCVEIEPPPDPGLPDEREQLSSILGCISEAPWGWGRRSLVRILRGDPAPRRNERPLHERARTQAQFGDLAFRSERAIERMLDGLTSGGFLRQRRLDNGGIVLDLTAAGKAALQDPGALDKLLSPTIKSVPSPRKVPKPEQPEEARAEPEVDEALFEKLRAWRRTQAQAQKVPPYVVFHDNHLRAISAHRPVTLEELSKVKGVGEARLAKYGTEVIEIVRAHMQDDKE